MRLLKYGSTLIRPKPFGNVNVSPDRALYPPNTCPSRLHLCLFRCGGGDRLLVAFEAIASFVLGLPSIALPSPPPRPSSAHSHSYPTPFPACLPPSPLFSLLSVRVGGRPHTPQEATRSGCGREGSRHRLCPGHAHLAEGSTRALVRSHCELQLQEAHREPPAV